MKKKKNDVKLAIAELDKLLEKLVEERKSCLEAMKQLGKAGKYDLKLSDAQMDFIERFFRGKVAGLYFSIIAIGDVRNILSESRKAE